MGGTNVDNCPHACVARPCGPLAKCVPHLENYECQCNPTNALCNKAEELSSESISLEKQIQSTKSTNVKTTPGLIPDKTTPYPIVKSSDSKTITKETTLTTSQIGFGSKNPVKSSFQPPTEDNNDDDDDDYYDDDYKYDESSSNTNRNIVHITSISKSSRHMPNSNEFIMNQQYTTELSNTQSGLGRLNNEGDDKQQASTRVLGRYMSVNNEQLLKEDHQQNDEKWKKISAIKNTKNKKAITYESDRMTVGSSGGEYMTEAQINDETVVNFYSDEDALTTKELIDDMERIMKNGEHIRAEEQHKKKNVKKNHGACFTGADSYFHYNDAETMREIISYKIDLNLRFKTHSMNGLILWTGRHSALEDDDYLSLGIENGYVY